MNQQKVYQKIRNCAIELTQNHQTYTRADLAYELKDYGIEQDSFDIVKLVYETYSAFRKDATAIAQAFIDNEQARSLVDIYKACDYSQNDHTNLSVWMGTRSKTIKQVLNSLHTNIKQTQKENNIQITNNIINNLTGAAKTQNIKNTANEIFKHYTQMINAYAATKTEIKAIILDFVAIRENILFTYRKYASALIDTFGESIKSIAPQLFDFDTVTYLDEQHMLQQVKLEYNNISNSCSTLISEIGESFATTIRQSAAVYRQLGGNKMGMLVAGLNMVNHYLQTEEKNNQLKQDLIRLETAVQRDATVIKGDAARLNVIYKTLNELYIPRALAYYKYADNVLSKELNALLDSLYITDELKSLREERNTYEEKLQSLEYEIIDNQNNINTYTVLLKQYNQLRQDNSAQYHQAKTTKPKKPFFLWNLLSFGYMRTKYNRAIYEWDLIASPVIQNYEDILIDIKLNTDELTMHREMLDKRKHQQKQLVRQISKINKAILSQIHTQNEVKLKLLDHLEPTLNLIRIAKEIVESSLDSKILATVDTPPMIEFEMPKLMKESIDKFSNSLRSELGGPPCNTIQINKKQDIIKFKSEIAQQFISTLESYESLQAMHQQGVLQQEAYKQELARIQDKFAKDITIIKNESTELQEIIKKINTATNHEDLKHGLLALSQNIQPSLTLTDIDQFLTGKKTIII